MKYIIVKQSPSNEEDYSIMSFKYSRKEAETSLEALRAKEDRYIFNIIEMEEAYDKEY